MWKRLHNYKTWTDTENMIVSTRQVYIIVRAHGSEISRIAQPIKTELLVVFLLIVDELGNRGNKRDKSLPKARTIIFIDKERGHRSTIHLTHFAPNPEWVYLFVSFATSAASSISNTRQARQ